MVKSNSQNASFSFKPPVPKQVPDFEKLHKEFASTMEEKKSSTKLTSPKPFNFNEPKHDPNFTS
jgi:hypothetical protein